MREEGKRNDAARPKLPRRSSTLPRRYGRSQFCGTSAPSVIECAWAGVADQLHRVAADTAAIFVNLVIFDRDNLDASLFEERAGLLRGCVHDDLARLHRDRVGRISVDFLARALDQVVADLVKPPDRPVIAPGCG
jgi:hypothetical protein